MFKKNADHTEMYEKHCSLSLSYNCFFFKSHEMFDSIMWIIFDAQNRTVCKKKIYYYRW